MTKEDIKKAIDVMKVCQMAWADQIPNDGEKISDYDALKQAIKCLDEYLKDCFIFKETFER